MSQNKIEEILDNYVQAVSTKCQHEETSEMGYRTDFEILLKNVFESISISRFDHDAKAKQGNKPDFVVVKNSVPLLYIETKDLGVSLDKIEKSEQMARYFGYANLILTDYLEFRFYRNGLSYGESIRVGDYDKTTKSVIPKQENFEYLAKTLIDFTQSHKEPIKSGKHLAKIMGGKAQRIRNNVRHLFETGSESNADLVKLYESIKQLLVHDLTPHTFADMYAQTLVYGLFVARFHDKTPDSFSRTEARDLIPNTNKFLKQFFDHIVGAEFKNSLRYLVDELCKVFSHADVSKLMKEYYKPKEGEQKIHDPVIHFYEDFLNEYDSELRKKMGAYYTPRPVVEFIVKSVDRILKNDFGLEKGLVDTSKLENGIHRVQILDPATGTGTFIGVIITEIFAHFLKTGQKGRWPAYVHNDLLPRIHGFELMMAPYTIAHLRLGIAFRKTGFWDFHRRLGIYLTNTLEEGTAQQLPMAFGLAECIAEESKEAVKIKTKTPIMVIVGNPPYSGESSNVQYKGNDVYKVEPKGGKLRERNSKWLNDDYVKFIRFAESMVEKNGEGVVGMITAHGYVDNPTFRGMRWHLMKTFDEIYVLDLHGNTNKKEKAPDGGEDKNVFDIRTGVAIFFGIKKKNNKLGLAKIYKADLYGKRFAKFKYLSENLINSIKWTRVNPVEPNYEWVVRDEELRKEYNKGFSMDNLFPVSSVGIVTSRDKFIIDSDKKVLIDRLQSFLRCQSPQEAKVKFNLRENKKWKIAEALKHEFDESNVMLINYRPFDARYIYYHDDFIERSRRQIMKNYLDGDNVGFLVTKANRDQRFQHIFATSSISEVIYLSGVTATNAINIPLYIHVNDGIKEANLNKIIVDEIEKIIGKVTPISLFEYVYAVLYSSSYRKIYNEFLNIDFPRIPYPQNKDIFEKLVTLGRELRQLHLLESSKVNSFITTYPKVGSNEVEKLSYKNGRVYINENQYFGDVPEIAWNFYIGGYQPAQKWLKDRKGNTLTNSDIEHYQKMMVSLLETNRLMLEIDKVILKK